MKRVVLLFIVSTFALVSAGCSATRSVVVSEADRVTAAHVGEMLTARLYKVDFTRAYPVSAPPFSLDHLYFISVIDNRVESFLPYFGRAYSTVYGGGEGLRFAAPITGYTDVVKRNGRREIDFTATTDEDRYEFSLTIFPLGECDLSISASRKQSISFTGRVDLNPEFSARPD